MPISPAFISCGAGALHNWSVNLYGKKMDSCADGHSHGAYRISGDHRDGSRQQRGK